MASSVIGDGIIKSILKSILSNIKFLNPGTKHISVTSNIAHKPEWHLLQNR